MPASGRCHRGIPRPLWLCRHSRFGIPISLGSLAMTQQLQPPSLRVPTVASRRRQIIAARRRLATGLVIGGLVLGGGPAMLATAFGEAYRNPFVPDYPAPSPNIRQTGYGGSSPSETVHAAPAQVASARLGQPVATGEASDHNRPPAIAVQAGPTAVGRAGLTRRPMHTPSDYPASVRPRRPCRPGFPRRRIFRPGRERMKRDRLGRERLGRTLTQTRQMADPANQIGPAKQFDPANFPTFTWHPRRRRRCCGPLASTGSEPSWSTAAEPTRRPKRRAGKRFDLSPRRSTPVAARDRHNAPPPIRRLGSTSHHANPPSGRLKRDTQLSTKPAISSGRTPAINWPSPGWREPTPRPSFARRCRPSLKRPWRERICLRRPRRSTATSTTHAVNWPCWRLPVPTPPPSWICWPPSGWTGQTRPSCPVRPRCVCGVRRCKVKARTRRWPNGWDFNWPLQA